MLNRQEKEYFYSFTDYIKKLFNVNVDIFPLAHRTIIDMGEDEEVLGCCHKMKDRNGQFLRYIITVDEPYIRACYYGRRIPHSPYSDNHLIETICHEIAHLFIWQHGKKHTELTNRLYDSVIDSLAKKKHL